MAASGLRCFVWAFSSCGMWELLSSCRAWGSHCGGSSCCEAQALGAQASMVVASRLSSCSSWALELTGFSSCGMRDQQLWLTGSVAPQHVKSARERDQTHVPSIDRQILKCCATSKVLPCALNLRSIHLNNFGVKEESGNEKIS